MIWFIFKFWILYSLIFIISLSKINRISIIEASILRTSTRVKYWSKYDNMLDFDWNSNITTHMIHSICEWLFIYSLRKMFLLIGNYYSIILIKWMFVFGHINSIIIININYDLGCFLTKFGSHFSCIAFYVNLIFKVVVIFFL